MIDQLSASFDNLLSNLLEGKTFHEWSESTIDHLSPDTAPIDLRFYFIPRKIRDVVFDRKLSFPARIIKEEKGFVIQLNKKALWNDHPHYRFLVAHEIAHTFEYTFSNRAINNKTYFLPGSSEAEYFSNRIGRNILLPRKLLLLMLADEEGGNSRLPFSFRTVDRISRQFNIHTDHVFTRLINDLSFWSSILILIFIKNTDDPHWHLNKLYLDNERSYYENELPVQKRYLSGYLDKLEEKLKDGSEKRVFIRTEDLKDHFWPTFMMQFPSGSSLQAQALKINHSRFIALNICIFLDLDR